MIACLAADARIITSQRSRSLIVSAALVTTAVVVGAGLPGLAVASELSRLRIDTVVVEGLSSFSYEPPARTGIIMDAAALSERGRLLRLLRGYAASHELDIRRSTGDLVRLGGPSGPPAGGGPRWAVSTETGAVRAEHVVLTGCGQSQLRRFIKDLGITAADDTAAALQALGIALVGVGDLTVPTTREIVRQAKTVSEAIAAALEPARLSG